MHYTRYNRWKRKDRKSASVPVLCAPRRCAKTCHPSGDIPSTWHSHHAGDEVIRHHAGISHHAGECHHAGDSVLRYHAGISHRAGECHRAGTTQVSLTAQVSATTQVTTFSDTTQVSLTAQVSATTQVTTFSDTTQVSLTAQVIATTQVTCHHASDEVSRYHTGISHHAGECHHAGDRESGYQAGFSHLAGECSTQVTKDVDTTQVSPTSCGQCHHAGAHPVSFIIRKKQQQLFAVQPRHRQGMKPFLRLIIVAKQFVSLITRKYPPCHFLHRSRGVGVPIWHNFMGSVGLIWGRACHFVVICGFYMVL